MGTSFSINPKFFHLQKHIVMKQPYSRHFALAFAAIVAIMCTSHAMAGDIYFAHAKVTVSKTGAGYVYGVAGSSTTDPGTGKTIISPEIAMDHQLESLKVVNRVEGPQTGEATADFMFIAVPRDGYRFAGWQNLNCDWVDRSSLMHAEVTTTNYAGQQLPFEDSAPIVDPHANDPDYCDATFVAVFEPAGSFEMNGDVNGDGIVDVTDVSIAIDIVLGKDSNDNYGGRANINGDSTVDVTDVSMIIDIVLGKSY